MASRHRLATPIRPLTRISIDPCWCDCHAQLESSKQKVASAIGQNDGLGQQVLQIKQVAASDTMMDGAEYKENSAPADAALLAFRRTMALQLKPTF